MTTLSLKRLAISAFSLLVISVSSTAHAQVAIDQNRAMAGNVAPGDTPGFPVTLSLAGSYKLTSNLVVPANAKGIQISADGVTLDLNGFSITGPVTCNHSMSPPCTAAADATGHGIEIQGQRAVIHDGSVRGFAGSGIWTNMPGGTVVHDVLLAHNSGHGIHIASIGGSFSAAGTKITRVVAVQNGGSGVAVAGGATATFIIDDSTASANGLTGFSLGGGHGVVTNCVAEENSHYGLVGDLFTLLRGSRLLNNAFGEFSGVLKSGGGNLAGNTLF